MNITTDEDLDAAIGAADPADSAAIANTDRSEGGELDQRALADLARIRTLPYEEQLAAPPAPLGRQRSAGKRATPTRWIALAAAACAVTATAGLGFAHVADPGPSPVVAAGSDAERLLGALGPVSAGDYQPYASTSALAAESDLVVTGRVAGLRPGRVMAFTNVPDGPTMNSLVVEIADPIAVQGTLPTEGDGVLYVEVPLGAEDALYPEDAARLLKGTEVAAYVQVAWRGERSDEFDNYIVDPDAGRPQGQPLYATTGPQGLVLQSVDGQLVWPMMRTSQPGDLQQALPGGSAIGHY